MTDPFATTATSSLAAPAIDTTEFRRQMQLASTGTRALYDEMDKAATIGSKFGSSLGTAFEGLVLKGKSLGDTVRTLGQSLSQIAFRTAFKPLEQAIGNGFGNIIGSLTSTSTGATSLVSGTPTAFAKGGVIASPTAFPLGGGTGLAGERGAEAIMPLARGPDGSLGVAASGGNGVNVTFNVNATDVESFRRSETQVTALLARAVGRGQRNL